MAKEVTSDITTKNIDGSESQFRTVTSYDIDSNGLVDVQKTTVQQSVSEEEYNKLDDDLQGGSSDGVFFQNIRTDQNGTNTYTTAASKEVQKLLNDSNASLKKDLDLASVDAIQLQDSNAKTWSLYSEYPSLENVAFTPDLEIVDPLGESSVDEETFVAIDPNYTIESFEIAGERQTTYENLYYPYDIATSNQDRIVFKMFYQSGRSLNFDLSNSEGSIFEFGNRSKTTIEGSVTLPIQGGIQDNNQVDFNGATLNPVQGALASVALNPLQAISQVGSILNMSPDEISRGLRTPMASNTINALRVFLAQSAVGGSGLIPRTTGAILNPNLELLLKAPTLRSFNFAFKMSARSSTEAQQIRKIIRFFKQGMSVKRSPSSLFVVSPNMFSIQYLAGGEGNLLQDHPSIGKIKDCALTALNTNYTPDGTYMTFDDAERTMTSYTINMQFTELDPLTETDYIETAANEDSIGY